MNTHYRTAWIVVLMTLMQAAMIPLYAQSAIRGKVIDEASGQGIPDITVHLQGTDLETITDASGTFSLEGEIPHEVVLDFSKEDVHLKRSFARMQSAVDLGDIVLMFQSVPSTPDQIFTVQLSDDDDDQNSTENVSGLLTASEDAFQSAVAYVFGPMRFRLRGYDSENSAMVFNGLPFNDLEVGSIFWSAWGGLNDVTRNQETHLGLEDSPFSFGGAGGSVGLDLRASAQRVQKRVSYSLANRAYRNRLMATWSTGMTPKGWALSLSASHRWAQEGYIEGTFYDAYGYFVSVDKKLSDKHLLNLVVLGAPTKRGRNSAATQEMYDLAGTHYYNPYWGYQNGEKRNSRVADIHEPIIALRHDWKFAKNSILTTSVGYQFGKNASSALDWYNANDPRPDYYRRLPSYIDDPTLAATVADVLRSDKALRQIQWDELYQANDASMVTIHDVDGIPGNDVTGKQSQYIVEDRRYDNTRLIAATNLQHVLSERVTLNGGLHYSWQRNQNYKVVKDLLGGDFYVNYDKFALQDFPGNTNALQNDLNHPNQLLYEGDVFGYDYDANIRDAEAWAQVTGSLAHWDLFAAVTSGHTDFWRTGHMRNGKFPEDSYGDSEKKAFTHGGIKGGTTWKIDGRNYLVADAMYLTRAPFFRNAMVSPRTRNEFVDGLTTEKIYGGEAAYVFRAPYFRARLTGYFTQFNDQAYARSFYHDDLRSFVNISMTGIDERHLGLEAFAEATVATGIKVHGVAAIGRYRYTSRPNAVITQDNDASVLDEMTVYAKDFYVGGTPQSVYTLGMSIQTKYYLSAYLNFNYFDNLWIDYNPVRRTTEAVDLVESGSPQWDAIIDQEKVPGGFTMDASVYKSFRLNWFKTPAYFAVSLNVTNVLDNQDLINGGYEQLRFDFVNHDPGTFPSKYYYFSGFNYYLNASIRF